MINTNIIYPLIISLNFILIGCSGSHKSIERPREGLIHSPSQNTVLRQLSNDTATEVTANSNKASRVKDKKTTPLKKYVNLNVSKGKDPNIDIYEKPTIKSVIITRVPTGTSLELLEFQGVWMKVKTPGGMIGWLSTVLLR